MKIGNFFLASIFLPSFLIVCAEEKTEVNTCDEYAARNKKFKVEYEIEPIETITDKNISCIFSFGSDQQCRFESKIFEAGSKYPSKECHNLLSSPNITFDGTKCALEFNKNNNVTNLIKDKLLHNFNNAFV